MMMVNEFFIYSLSLGMLLFTDWVPDLEMQEHIGWAYVAAIFWNLALNFSFIFLKSYNTQRLIAVKYKIIFDVKVLGKPRP